MIKDIIELELESLKDGLLASERFFNKPLVIFNSASHCGFTKQLSEFQTLYTSNSIIPIALPTNEFGSQEPGDNYEIIQFAKNKYGITFPICKKTDLNHKLFKLYGTPDWNFNKYLFDKNHKFIERFNSKVNPSELLKYV